MAEGNSALVDHLGDVLVATKRGVERLRQGVHRYRPAEGWPSGAQGSLYETRAGDIWLARWQVSSFLGRWKRDSNRPCVTGLLRTAFGFIVIFLVPPSSSIQP